VAITFEILTDQATVLGRGMERFRFRPWGLEGGSAGALARTLLNAGTANEKNLGKIDTVTVKRGDLFTILTPGAGGYGNPFERDSEQVADDVRKGFITIEAAARRYGVALTTDGTVDAAKTSALRANAPAADTVDPAREAFDEIFPDADVTALNHRLYDLPPGPANHRRSRIFARVLDDLDTGQIAATSHAERSARRALFSDLVSAEIARK
jgi:N-methylhydantoinase B